MEVLRPLFAEGMYEHTTIIHRRPLLPYTQVVFLIESVKMMVALVMVLQTTRNWSLAKIEFFLPPAGLYFVNNCLYYWVLRESSTGAMSLLMHLRLPFTAVVHHFLIRRQTSWKAWVSLALVFTGVSIAQLTDDLTLDHGSVVIVAGIMCLNSAFASVINERILKTLDMPFWDQQLRMYTFGFIASFLGIFGSSYIEPGSLTAEMTTVAVISTIGCILTGAAAGIFTGFLMYRLDNIVKVIANAMVTVLVALCVFVLFGLFPFTPAHFAVGSLMLLGGSYLYAIETSRDSETYRSIDEESGSPKAPSVRVTLSKFAVPLFSAIILLFLAQTATRDIEDPFIALFIDKPVIVVAYASNINLMFCRTFRSFLSSNLTVLVVGHLQSADKSAKPAKYLEISQKLQHLNEHQIIAFSDGYDVYAQQNEAYIVNQVKEIGSDIIYSAEKNCWPFSQDFDADKELCPRYKSNQKVKELYAPGLPVRYPNSGLMFCKAKSCLGFLEKSLEMKPKFFEEDDQAIAHEACLAYDSNCKLDLFSRIAQSMHWSVPDVELVDGRYFNKVTNSTPAFIHFNGDKDGLGPMDTHAHIKTTDLNGRWIHFENGTKTSLTEVCAEHLDEIISSSQ